MLHDQADASASESGDLGLHNIRSVPCAWTWKNPSKYRTLIGVSFVASDFLNFKIL